MQFNFVTVLWGCEYVDYFLEATLPSLLSPRNIPALDKCQFSIYAPNDDLAGIQAADVLSRLGGHVLAVTLHPLQYAPTEDKHTIVTRAYMNSMWVAHLMNAAFVCVPPDAVWSDGSFEFMQTIAEVGKRGIGIAGVRTLRNTFGPEVISRLDKDGALESRSLFQLATDNFHPVTDSIFWDAAPYTRGPSHLYFNVNDEGMLARAFHLHPIMIRPTHMDFDTTSTVDGDVFGLAIPDVDDIHVVTSSDDMLVCEASDSSYRVSTTPSKASAMRVAKWATKRTDAHHRSFIEHPIRFHTCEPTDAWGPVQQKATNVVRKIKQRLAEIEK